MADYDIHISGGTIVDGTGVPRCKGDVWIKDGKIAQIGRPGPTGVAERVIDAAGKIVAPGFVDLPHPLRRPDPLGPVVHDLRLARRHVGRARQLRLRLRPVQARLPRPLDADDDPHRGDPVRVDAPGHGLGLGDDPGVPRLARPRAEGRQRHPVHADGVADDLRDGPRGGQVAPGHRPGAQGDAAPAARGHGRRPGRLLHPAPRAELGAGRLRRHARWSPTRWCDEDILALGRGARRARRGLHPDHPGRRRHQGRLRVPGEAGRGGQAARSCTTSSPRPATTPRCTAGRCAGSSACREKGLPIFAQCATGRAGFAFTLEHWNLYDASPAWRAVTTGTKEEKIEKMQDPELRQALVDEAEEADQPAAGHPGRRRRQPRRA